MLRTFRRASGLRFVAVGLAMTVLHLAVFRLVSAWVIAEIANVVAFLVVTQVNFVVSYYWTWSDRRVGKETARSVLRRAVVFNGSAALGFGVNAAVFSMAYRGAGSSPMVSALVATVVSAAASFLLSSRVVFVRPSMPAADRAPVLPPALGIPVAQFAPRLADRQHA
jgi:putative flippase GtrA